MFDCSDQIQNEVIGCLLLYIQNAVNDICSNTLTRDRPAMVLGIDMCCVSVTHTMNVAAITFNKC